MVVRVAMTLVAVFLLSGAALAQDPGDTRDPRDPPITPDQVIEKAGKAIDNATEPKNIVTTLEIIFLLTILTLAPSILVMMTSFTRIVVVLSFVRRALATQELPPNQVIVGLALILTFMVMSPTFSAIKRDALDPYTAENPTVTQQEALEIATEHMRTFMFRHVRAEDLSLFMTSTHQPVKEDGWERKDVPTLVLIPAFVVSELRRAFIMGFALFLPFLVIDMVVASTLISMGMLVLPPILISLPFKILLFVLVDGWHLIIGSLIESFY
ncbi:MAG: flagellar type III secretion system pore protein FliP [Planctomycetota bacterium]|jgi:flagellar biosynthetic protein FliP